MLDSPLFGVFGRIHPMVLHLPIGVMIALLVLEVVGRVRGKPASREVRLTLAWFGAAVGLITAVSGLQLSRESAYTAEGVWLHQVLGIAAAVLAVACAALLQAGKIATYVGALVLCVAALVPAGHFGAGLTHGEDFLFEPLRPKKSPEPVRGGDAAATMPTPKPPAAPIGVSVIPGIDAQVAAIFHKSCIGCHNATKLKGGLALDTADALRNGGDGGAVVIAGKPQSSELMIRLNLTPGDKEHMPPPGRTPLTGEEVAIIRAWIEKGGKGIPTAP